MSVKCHVFVTLLIACVPIANSLSEYSAVFAQSVYGSVFRLRDGSILANADTSAVNSMLDNSRRLLACRPGDDVIGTARNASDAAILRILFLAVAGNFTVDQSPSALPQRCGLVTDPMTGALVLRDNSVTRSVILEVLVIVSIVCLLRVWGSGGT